MLEKNPPPHNLQTKRDWRQIIAIYLQTPPDPSTLKVGNFAHRHSTDRPKPTLFIPRLSDVTELLEGGSDGVVIDSSLTTPHLIERLAEFMRVNPLFRSLEARLVIHQLLDDDSNPIRRAVILSLRLSKSSIPHILEVTRHLAILPKHLSLIHI